MPDDQFKLLSERMARAVERVQRELKEMRSLLEHNQALLEQRVSLLESASRDHETRLREAHTGITQFKVWSGLTSGSSGLLSLLALLRTFLGR
ncbi:MAG: hypothetical protein HPY85_17130 [Anaerolineae bacterium]|jgi:excinuclease UvrABC helicase subunit UvrB|nr:hypothetical protein [Anaerolineae bacterium]